MKLSRRSFLKVAGATGTASLVTLPTMARGAEERGENESAVLVDTTLCRGCRACEAACAEQNELPDPPAEDVYREKRSTSPTAFTVVNAFENPRDPGTPRYVKRQCMHCIEPACATACPVRAIEKLPYGPVAYHPERCMGCRYCMVACPFGVPKYEYSKAIPRVRKCTFCFARQDQGKGPACATVCPSGALKFGKRGELVLEARRRVFGNPDKYVPYIYGEHEAGGTNWLYVSDIPFELLDFNVTVADSAFPERVKGALSVPPFVMTLWPPLLMGLYAFSHRKNDVSKAEHGTDEEGRHE